MKTPTVPAGLKPWLPLLAGAVIVALLIGVGAGRLLGPVSVASPSQSPSADASPSVAADGHVHGGSTDGTAPQPDVGGLSLSYGGYTLVPDSSRYPEKDGQSFDFTIVDTQGIPVTDFAVVHDKPMHLFAVRRDLTGYQHLHPSMDADTGTWHAEIDFGSAGLWRVIADFAVNSAAEPVAVTLGTDVTVPGDYQPDDLPKPKTTAEVDGLEVSMDFVSKIGVNEPVLMTVTRDGEPVELEPYLGAFGRLVMLRADDLGFAHVHPDTELLGGAMRFWATVPSTGSYRLFLDFQVDGEVHTAQFTLRV